VCVCVLHFVAIQVRRQSLVSNVFRILRYTTVIKISLFFILVKKMKRVGLYRILL